MAISAKQFDPNGFMASWSDKDHVPNHDNEFSLRECIIKAFDLPENDDYIYRAQGVTTLELTQKAINGKRAHGLHAWYHDNNLNPVGYISPNTLRQRLYL